MLVDGKEFDYPKKPSKFKMLYVNARDYIRDNSIGLLCVLAMYFDFYLYKRGDHEH